MATLRLQHTIQIDGVELPFLTLARQLVVESLLPLSYRLGAGDVFDLGRLAAAAASLTPVTVLQAFQIRSTDQDVMLTLATVPIPIKAGGVFTAYDLAIPLVGPG